MDLRQQKKGIVFFTTLILLALTVLICSSVAMVVLRDKFTVRKMKDSTQSLYLAEVAMEEVLVQLNNNYNSAITGYPKSLAGGTYTITVEDDPVYGDRKNITATGTYDGVDKIIKVQVNYIGPLAFQYASMAGGKIIMYGGDEGVTLSNEDGDPVNIHSNANDPANPANVIVVGWPINTGNQGTGTLQGNASAASGNANAIRVAPGSVITGIQTLNAGTIPSPPFDADFFNQYQIWAQEDGTYFDGDRVYRNRNNDNSFYANPCNETLGANHVVFINGDVDLSGTWEMTGCLVATGHIMINDNPPGTEGVVTINQWGNLPALMSSGTKPGNNKGISIKDPTNVEGMIYANEDIKIKISAGLDDPTVIRGAVYTPEDITLRMNTQLNYVRPNPPGLATSGSGVNILSWTEDM